MSLWIGLGEQNWVGPLSGVQATDAPTGCVREVPAFGRTGISDNLPGCHT
jgi:hypothetical protein